MNIKEYHINVLGVVQGIGFRPAIYKIAKKYSVNGEIGNSSEGVSIIIQTTAHNKDLFINEIKGLDLPGIRIEHFSITQKECIEYFFEDFKIKRAIISEGMTEIPIDSAMCPECVDDLYKRDGNRYLYPLTACTNCGPRITIIKKMPYDRLHTTMSNIGRCEECENNYVSPVSRRFNFETDSCWKCTPWMGYVSFEKKQYWAIDGCASSNFERDLISRGFICKGKYANGPEGMAKLLQLANNLISQNKVLAIKGVGGYQLVCDASSFEAVQKIRDRKHRKSKPLAIMYPNLEEVEKDCHIVEPQKKLLASRSAPIVLVRKKKTSGLASNVVYENNCVGAMLPNSPIHKILVDKPLIMTSANISGEPLIYDEKNVVTKLIDLSDGILMHDRPINMSVDDSLVKYSPYGNIILRYARGFIPSSVNVKGNPVEGIALGADVKSAFTIISKDKLILSQYIGDLVNSDVNERFSECIKKYCLLYNTKLQVVAVDKHPGYFSTAIGNSIAKAHNLPIVSVQHHYAHALSVMAEHSLQGLYVSIVLDGTGYGDDQLIWGGEILLATPSNYRRMFHFEYIDLVGGEKAVKQPFRILIGIMDRLDEFFLKKLNCLFKDTKQGNIILERECISKNKLTISQMKKNNLNCIKTSSAGRIFDLVASLILGMDTYNFEGEAASFVEQGAQQYLVENEIKIDEVFIEAIDEECYKGLDLRNWVKIGKDTIVDGEIKIIDIVINSMYIYECSNDQNYSLFAFHFILAVALATSAQLVYVENNAKGCVLSGGVFQNSILRDLVILLLKNEGVDEVYYNINTPANDGGISLGQSYFIKNMNIEDDKVI